VGTVLVVSIVTSLIVSTLTVLGLMRFGQDAVARIGASAQQTVQVPDLSGMRSAAADELLTARGLRLVVSERRKADSEAEMVIEQSPLPQSRVEPGAQVSVAISAGKEGANVPAVVGVQLEQAKAMVQNAGLVVGALNKVDAGTSEPGTVVEVAPAVGTALAPGSPVVLSVADLAKVKVPRLLNQHVREAREQIEKAGLLVGQVRERYDNRRKAYVVLEQTPEPGTEAAQGSNVDLIVNQGD
jgi:serine/threonine-protein kinase